MKSFLSTLNNLPDIRTASAFLHSFFRLRKVVRSFFSLFPLLFSLLLTFSLQLPAASAHAAATLGKPDFAAARFVAAARETLPAPAETGTTGFPSFSQPPRSPNPNERLSETIREEQGPVLPPSELQKTPSHPALEKGCLQPKQIQESDMLQTAPLSLTVQNGEIRETAAALARLSGKNIVLAPSVQGTASLHLQNVTLKEALDALCRAALLRYTQQGNYIFLEAAAVAQPSGDVHVFLLNYARAEEMQKLLSGVIPTGKLAADPVTNSLLYNGDDAAVQQIGQALRLLDRAGRQVTLEAKILAVNRSTEKTLGIKWNWDILPRYPAAQSDKDSAAKDESASGTSDADYPGHLRLWKGSQSQFRFYATLNALLTSGKAKLLATPSLITLPGKEASIFIGSHIPVITEKHNNGESTYATEYLDAGIKLRYTPIVSRDGMITATVHTEVSTPALVSELKNYRINSRTADTTVRMRNGETLVIGGLLSEEEQKQMQEIPLLSKIPLLGELFKHRYSVKTKTEVIMLLTPYITDPGESPAIYSDLLREDPSLLHRFKQVEK